MLKCCFVLSSKYKEKNKLKWKKKLCVCTEQRLKSACASVQSDHGLSCPFTNSFDIVDTSSETWRPWSVCTNGQTQLDYLKYRICSQQIIISYFFFFSEKISNYILCESFPQQMFHRIYQVLLSLKNKNTNTILTLKMPSKIVADTVQFLK